mmetsp:Transcript_26704/g.67294  ORF Transcript_26704/g.67294 Transcript_26704/m.67294 type:complete len:376 (+) Transcript_26704:3567-4694(+)
MTRVHPYRRLEVREQSRNRCHPVPNRQEEGVFVAQKEPRHHEIYLVSRDVGLVQLAPRPHVLVRVRHEEKLVQKLLHCQKWVLHVELDLVRPVCHECFVAVEVQQQDSVDSGHPVSGGVGGLYPAPDVVHAPVFRGKHHVFLVHRDRELGGVDADAVANSVRLGELKVLGADYLEHPAGIEGRQVGRNVLLRDEIKLHRHVPDLLIAGGTGGRPRLHFRPREGPEHEARHQFLHGAFPVELQPPIIQRRRELRVLLDADPERVQCPRRQIHLIFRHYRKPGHVGFAPAKRDLDLRGPNRVVRRECLATEHSHRPHLQHTQTVFVEGEALRRAHGHVLGGFGIRVQLEPEDQRIRPQRAVVAARREPDHVVVGTLK